ncbi:MAG: DUF1152 domain-containing protein [Lewinella sp.]|uniref:DUF1152 domain-containing protein n=1 Tax=Lewinella sp. TaxID=2004506 RepID=UPI003D6BC484
MTHLDKNPFFDRIKESKNVLLAGAGGGFDIYSGIPIYQNLINSGKNVVLANYSFTLLEETTSEEVFPNCYKVRMGDSDKSGRNYFPEKYLCSFLGSKGAYITVYGLSRVGVQPTRDTYNYIIKEHDIDTVILVDGGTDSLMFGDEEGLGTPQEDICSMAAAHRTGVKNQILLSIGFGVDHYHGVSHYRFLENISELTREGGYLGVFHLLPDMEEAILLEELVEYANIVMRGRESIVANSIVSAVQGNYGDFHRTKRTKGSELWINPLMSMYWAFDLHKVIRKIKYYDEIKASKTIGEFNMGLSSYRQNIKKTREKKNIPI